MVFREIICILSSLYFLTYVLRGSFDQIDTSRHNNSSAGFSGHKLRRILAEEECTNYVIRTKGYKYFTNPNCVRERGDPAILGVMAENRMHYPARSLDMAHCFRCSIP